MDKVLFPPRGNVPNCPSINYQKILFWTYQVFPSPSVDLFPGMKTFFRTPPLREKNMLSTKSTSIFYHPEPSLPQTPFQSTIPFFPPLSLRGRRPFSPPHCKRRRFFPLQIYQASYPSSPPPPPPTSGAGGLSLPTEILSPREEEDRFSATSFPIFL